MTNQEMSPKSPKGLAMWPVNPLQCDLAERAVSVRVGVVGCPRTGVAGGSTKGHSGLVRSFAPRVALPRWTRPPVSALARGAKAGGRGIANRPCKSVGPRCSKGLTRSALLGRMRRISRVGGGTSPCRFSVSSGAATRSVLFDPLHLFSAAPGMALPDFGVRDGPGGEVKHC